LLCRRYRRCSRIQHERPVHPRSRFGRRQPRASEETGTDAAQGRRKVNEMLAGT
jgi:hypothetical protein